MFKGKETFSPYQAARTLRGSNYLVGINWSYVSFSTEALCDDFIKQCDDHSYNTRNKHYLIQVVGPPKWAVQYCHHQDQG